MNFNNGRIECSHSASSGGVSGGRKGLGLVSFQWTLFILLLLVASGNASSLGNLTVLDNSDNERIRRPGWRWEKKTSHTSFMEPDNCGFNVHHKSIIAIDVTAGGSDKQTSMKVDYTIQFNVIAVTGETWKLNIKTSRRMGMVVNNDGGTWA